MRFKLDENLGIRGVEILRLAGHDVMTVRDQFLCGETDERLIDICRRESRCLITLDFDFADTLTYPPERFAGIILIRLPRTPVLNDVDVAMSAIVCALKQNGDMKGKLWIVRKTNIRQYQQRNHEE